ncbi:stage II sporulation protein R [Fodinisporobacter ferrooxydans]|uniref:Stage II sporulation protein R n=1 Tax=Fodinisporobacter ferrooxydans TaxID=2901836 RepID=A0ABY4CM76_9BACL|nr:stage II sporulation protein R [Alicyclobacillaceae bacterium MYW30-H2]
MSTIPYIKKIALISLALFLTDNSFSSMALANSTVQVTPKANISPQATADLEDEVALLKGTIPQNAVRLRIIANSDSSSDQQLKRDVRDKIIAAVGQLLHGATTKEQAETILKRAVPRLDQIAQSVIRQEGYTYPTQTEVGVVAFPTKLYGNQVYPAGDYEALRIIIGQGKGQNWWCVLFPPLCFVDLANGDAVPNTKDFPDHKPAATIQVGKTATSQGETVQVRFAILDYGKKLIFAIEHLFQELFHSSADKSHKTNA